MIQNGSGWLRPVNSHVTAGVPARSLTRQRYVPPDRHSTNQDRTLAMRLMRLGQPGSEIPAVLTAEGTHLDLRPVTRDIDGAFLSGQGLDQARAAVAAGTLPALDATGLRVGPPVARPGAVLCIGMNYAAHAAETGAAPPERPVLFYKAPNTVVG